jgi:hypothetical protein
MTAAAMPAATASAVPDVGDQPRTAGAAEALGVGSGLPVGVGVARAEVELAAGSGKTADGI